MTADLLKQRSSLETAPRSDTARQAVNALRGYTYQLVASALAWINIDDDGRLYLEVAEDYAVVAGQALSAVQVKDTKKSGKITLNSDSVRMVIAAFVDLSKKNPETQVSLRLLTTSEIGIEQALGDRLGGISGLEYWRRAARRADVAPLRATLESDRFPDSVRDFCRARNDRELRQDLIKRIHWDCGSPNVRTLRQQLEARLIVVGRNLFGVSAAEVPRLADQLVYCVLARIVNTNDRVLTRADLYATIEESTHVSVPRTLLNDVLRGPPFSSVAEGALTHPNLSNGEPSWLFESSIDSVRPAIISRSGIESAISGALREFGVCVVVGASGAGKSVVSNAVAQSDPFVRADLGHIGVQETCHRLHMILARIGGSPSSVLILDDANRLDDKHVAGLMGRVIEASRRSDQDVIVTCYRKPSRAALFRINVDSRSIVDCPCFSEQEVSELVRNAGGDPKTWGRLAYMAAAGGHPQLTHAFVIGMAEQGWPVEEIDNVIHRGLTSSDIDAARDEARRAIVSALPDRARVLLHRLSLVLAPFNRSLALAVGAVPPQISQAGESMDQLVGPWIEPVGRDLFRVSPLAANFGKQMLTVDEQSTIHHAVAVEMVKKSTVDASDVNALTLHALAGSSTICLATVANFVLSAESNTLEELAEHLLVLRLFKTTEPIYDRDRLVSALLRLAQFMVVTAGGDQQETASHVYSALIRELDAITDALPRRMFEAFAIIRILCTPGAANYIHDWIDLLRRARVLVEANCKLQTMAVNVAEQDEKTQVDFFGILFSIGISNLASVDRLECIVNELDRVDAQERIAWLTPIHEEFSDYYTIINQPWVIEDRRGNLDAADAAERYSRMKRITQNWGDGTFAIQCAVAQAVMLYEYQNNNEGALSVLEDARATWGDNLILTRAFANLYHYCEEHEKAFEIYQIIAQGHGSAGSIEEAYRLRRSAISAATQDRWEQAKRWFLQARKAAKVAHSNDMTAMAIGLGADAAVAALHTGDTRQSLTLLAEALGALPSIDSVKTLRAAFCRRSVHAAVVWSRARIMNEEIRADGQPIRMAPGICSNPEPPTEAGQLQPIDVDISWYFLAGAEVAAGVDVGLFNSISDRLANGEIPAMEANLRIVTMQYAIDRLDTAGFSTHFIRYVESMDYLSKLDACSRASIDPTIPTRGQIPALDASRPVSPYAEQVAGDAILTYGIRGAIGGQPDIIRKLGQAITGRLPSTFPGKFMFDDCDEPANLPSYRDQIAGAAIIALRHTYPSPSVFFTAGLVFLSWIRASTFGKVMMPHLAAWQRGIWSRFVVTQAFRFLRPWESVPDVKRALSIERDDETFVAGILLAISRAIGAPIAAQDRDTLQAIADQRQSPSAS